MPRDARNHQPDTIYHVFSRGVERRPIFCTDADRQYFTAALLGALKANGSSLFALCLMGNHFHALIGSSNTPLGASMHAALLRHSMRFNRMHDRVGHLFQSRYHSNPVEDERYLLNVIAYIHLNPVRAKLVRHPSAWAWSTHNEWLRLGSDTVDFRRLEDLSGLTAIQLRDAHNEIIDSELSRKQTGISLAELIRVAASIAGISSEELIAGARGARATRAKRLILERAELEGYSISDVADALACSTEALYVLRKRRTNESTCPPR